MHKAADKDLQKGVCLAVVVHRRCLHVVRVYSCGPMRSRGTNLEWRWISVLVAVEDEG